MRSPVGDSRTHRDETTASLAAAACASSLKEPSASTKMSGKTSSPLARMTDSVGMSRTRTTKMRVKTVSMAPVTVFEAPLVSPSCVHASLCGSSCVRVRVCMRVSVCVLRFASGCACFCVLGWCLSVRLVTSKH